MYNDSNNDIDMIYNSSFNKYPRWRVVFKGSYLWVNLLEEKQWEKKKLKKKATIKNSQTKKSWFCVIGDSIIEEVLILNGVS